TPSPSRTKGQAGGGLCVPRKACFIETSPAGAAAPEYPSASDGPRATRPRRGGGAQTGAHSRHSPAPQRLPAAPSPAPAPSRAAPGATAPPPPSAAGPRPDPSLVPTKARCARACGPHCASSAEPPRPPGIDLVAQCCQERLVSQLTCMLDRLLAVGLR